MAKLHGSVFIIVGLLVAIISYLVGDGMVLFLGLGIGFFAFGIIKTFINGGKLKSREEVRRDVLERRSNRDYNRSHERDHRNIVGHHNQRLRNIRANHPNNHNINKY